MQRVKKFNKDCESFRNFNDAIRRDTTRRTYHYILDQLIRFGNFKGYDDLVNLDTDKIHDLLKEWVRDYKENGLKYKAIKLKLNVAELFFEMNKKIVYKRILHKMLPDSDEIPAGEFPFTTEEIWLMKKAAKKLRDMAIIDFLASTGVRPGSLSDPVIRMKYVEDMPNGCKSIRVYDGSKEDYLAHIDGMYGKDLKDFVIFDMLSKLEPVDYNEIKNMEIKDIKDYFKGVPKSNCLFEGYNNEIRNAIAHSSFWYDEKKKKIIFKDQQKAIHAKTIDELFEMKEKLSNIEDLVFYYNEIHTIDKVVSDLIRV